MLFIPYLFVFSSNASLSQNSFSSPLFHTPFSYIIFCHWTFPIPESQCFLLFFIWWLFSYLHTSYSATSLLYPASLKSSSSLPVFHSTSPLWRSLVLLSATSQSWDFLPAAEHFCGVCLMECMQHPYCREKCRTEFHSTQIEWKGWGASVLARAVRASRAMNPGTRLWKLCGSGEVVGFTTRGILHLSDVWNGRIGDPE